MAKVSEFLKAENPLTKGPSSLFDVKGIFGGIIWVVLTLFIIAMGQNVARMISGKVSRIDTSPEPIFSSPAAAVAGDEIL